MIIFIITLFLTVTNSCFSQDAKQKKTEQSKGKQLEAGDKQKASPPVPVRAEKAIKEDIPIQIKAVGNIEAYSEVTIRSQVSGILTEIKFEEGKEVKKGDLLFLIDKRPYEALLHKELANQKKNIIDEKNAYNNYKRLDDLNKSNIATNEEADNARTIADTKKAQLDIDNAAVEYARLQLEYCTIKSPVDGIAGDIMVDAGNLIKANDTTLVAINTVSPIYATFSIPEHDLLEVKKYSSKTKIKTLAIIPFQESNPAEGELTFLDNQVDKNTGTIKLKATFENKDKRLWPGQFVNITLLLAVESGAITVPSEAVQIGQNGFYVYIVKDDNTVEARSIKQGIIINGKSVIIEGINEGEIIVTDGHLRVAPGNKVDIKNSSDDSTDSPNRQDSKAQ